MKEFLERENCQKIPEIKIKEKSPLTFSLLAETKLTSSKSETKKLVFQKGVKIDNRIPEN